MRARFLVCSLLLVQLAICSPAAGSTVSSPVQMAAGSTDTQQVLLMDAFLDGNEVLESSGGQLTGPVNAAAGPHQLRVTAKDSGGGTAEQTINFTVNGTPGGSTAPLSLGITPSSAQINLGDSADFVLSVSSNGSLTEPVSFSCSNLPPGAQCTFNRNLIKPTELPTTVKLTIFTTAQSAMRRGRRDAGKPAVAGFLLGTVLMGVALGSAPGRRRRVYCSVVLLGMVAAAVIGCQGLVVPDNRGSFTATVTSTSGKVQQTSNIELTLK